MGRAQNTSPRNSPIVRRQVLPHSLSDMRETVAANSERIAALGHWPAYIDAESLTSRVPSTGQSAPGFDAGIACALDLIPRARQRLAARLHAAYTPEVVEQVRRETSGALDPDSESCWWLAACSVCEEGVLDESEFAAQCDSFRRLTADPGARTQAATRALADMRSAFRMRDGVAFASRDGGMQGAYISGHDVSAMFAEQTELYFVGTLRPSLELDGFAWEQPPNPDGGTRDERFGRSGPVHGSRQFVKCATAGEYERVIAEVRSRLGVAAF